MAGKQNLLGPRTFPSTVKVVTLADHANVTTLAVDKLVTEGKLKMKGRPL